MIDEALIGERFRALAPELSERDGTAAIPPRPSTRASISPAKAKGKAIPFGVYDIAANEGYVNVGITAETTQLAVASIRAWWEDLGRARDPRATALQITAVCGGANGNRTRLWNANCRSSPTRR